MKIILTQTVAGLGEAGTIKEVADGYARNYLLPQKLAVAATRGTVKQAETQAELYARRAGKAREGLQRAASVIDGKTVVIYARVGSENRLYGSVTAVDIADALLAQHGATIDRRKIALDEPIHRTGAYVATADFGNGVSAKFNVEVASETAGAQGKAAKATGEADTPAAVPTEGEDGMVATPGEATGGMEAGNVQPMNETAEAETAETVGETSDASDAGDVTPTTEAEAERQTEANPS